MPDLTTQRQHSDFPVGSLAIIDGGAEAVIVDHVISMIDGDLEPRIKVVGIDTAATRARGFVGTEWTVGLDEIAYKLVGTIRVGLPARVRRDA
jgi:hypothetical protein|tara:strand:- start:419 stop:697 length:279 start_codon:yes stop_codon:yes gene_type:complete